MEKAVFQRFYDVTVIPLRDEMCKGKKDIKLIDNFEGVYEEYLNQKTLLKLLLKKETNEEADKNDETNRLDRHKISACVTAAIIKTRLISNTSVNDTDTKEYLLRNSNRMNEQLAFYAGMSNLVAFMADENDDNIQELKESDFYFPETNHHTKRRDISNQELDMEQDYKDSIIRALYYSNTMSGVQTLMLSNIFFLLEAYHKQACELKKIKSNLA